ncbi:MAG: hypothetical protein WC755_04430 [Candidatus Woesearchaeota archaeon]
MRKNKGSFLLIFVFFVAIFSMISYSATSVFNGMIHDGDVVNGITFTVNSIGVYAAQNGTFVSIDKNDCDYLFDTEICVLSISFSDGKYLSQVTMYEKKYDFFIIRNFPKHTVYFGETANVTVMINNTGRIDASDFLYSDAFPNGFEVILNSNDGTLDKNEFKFFGNLKKGKTLNLTYAIRPILKSKAELRSKIFIDNNFFYSDLYLIETMSPILVSTQKSTHYCNVGDFFNYTIFVNTSIPINTKVDAILELPDSLQFLDGSRRIETIFNFNNYTIVNNTIINGSVQNKTFVMRCVFTGTDPIKIFSKADNGVKFNIDDVYDYVTVDFDALFMSDNVLKEYTSGESAKLFAFFKNNGNINLSDVTFSVTSNILPSKLEKVSLFLANTSYFLFDDYVNFPVCSSCNFHINISYFFFTDFGEKITDSKLFNMTVLEYSNISIISNINPVSVYSGDAVIVTVSLKNNMQAPLSDIEVYDEFNQRLFKSGSNANKISLNSKETKVVYSYTLYAPYTDSEKKEGTNTFVRYGYAGKYYFMNLSNYFTVLPKVYTERELKLSVVKSVIVPANFSIGDVLDINYRLENTDTISMKDIILQFPLSSSYVSVGEYQYVLSKLDPGEIVYLDSIEKIRPLFLGSFKIPATTVMFQDDYARLSTLNSNEIFSITVLKNSSFVKGPLLVINHTFTGYVKNGAIFKIVLLNKGSSVSDAFISYNRQRENFRLSSKESKVIDYTVYFNGNGNFTIPDVYVTYFNSEDNYTSYAKGTKISFKDYVASKKEMGVNDIEVSSESLIDTESVNNLEFTNIGKENITTSKNFFIINKILIIVILFSLILISIVFYEFKKHQL